MTLSRQFRGEKYQSQRNHSYSTIRRPNGSLLYYQNHTTANCTANDVSILNANNLCSTSSMGNERTIRWTKTAISKSQTTASLANDSIDNCHCSESRTRQIDPVTRKEPNGLRTKAIIHAAANDTEIETSPQYHCCSNNIRANDLPQKSSLMQLQQSKSGNNKDLKMLCFGTQFKKAQTNAVIQIEKEPSQMECSQRHHWRHQLRDAMMVTMALSTQAKPSAEDLSTCGKCLPQHNGSASCSSDHCSRLKLTRLINLKSPKSTSVGFPLKWHFGNRKTKPSSLKLKDLDFDMNLDKSDKSVSKSQHYQLIGEQFAPEKCKLTQTNVENCSIPMARREEVI